MSYYRRPSAKQKILAARGKTKKDPRAELREKEWLSRANLIVLAGIADNPFGKTGLANQALAAAGLGEVRVGYRTRPDGRKTRAYAFIPNREKLGDKFREVVYEEHDSGDHKMQMEFHKTLLPLFILGSVKCEQEREAKAKRKAEGGPKPMKAGHVYPDGYAGITTIARDAGLAAKDATDLLIKWGIAERVDGKYCATDETVENGDAVLYTNPDKPGESWYVWRREHFTNEFRIYVSDKAKENATS